MSFLTRPTTWFVSKFVNRPRLWTVKEWKKMTHKEKLWIWYKHHLIMKGHGSSEADQITNPVKDLVLYGSVVTSNILLFYLSLDVKIDVPNIVAFIYFCFIIAFLVNWIVQWKIGNWKDKHDLIALESGISNRRDATYRKLQNLESRLRWRKIK